MHFFMHRGRGGHGDHCSEQDKDAIQKEHHHQ
jgi:hypothetical protein